jgi:hypothetical protein
MPTSETNAGVDVLSKHPSKETELRCRISVDESGTKATLASIVAKRASEATDGASLAISTDAVGGELAQRLVIDDQGSVGIGSDAPQARLHVGGNGRFEGPLTVQGAVTGGSLSVGGGAEIAGSLSVGGDVEVRGKLRAVSLAGDGGELSNVTPADGSVTNAKLAEDAASLSKITAGLLGAKDDKIGIGTTAPFSSLEVKGDWTNERGALELSGHKPTIRFTGGSDLADRSWIIHLGGNGPGDLELYTKTPSASDWTPRMLLTQNGVNVVGSLSGTSNNPGLAGVQGVHTAGQAAVIGTSDAGRGVLGLSKSGQGVWGESETSTGVVGVSKNGWAVHGDGATGVVGIGKQWLGVYGETNGPSSSGPAGVWGEGKQSGNGVKGQTSLANAAGVIGINVPNAGPGVEGWGKPAGLFRGECRAASFPTLSDERLKTNVVPLRDILAKLANVRGVFFEWTENQVVRSPGKREIGVLAQEVEAILPELVSDWEDDKGYKGVDYGRLAAVLLEAVKEVAQKFETLDGRVSELNRLMRSEGESLRQSKAT